MTLEPPEKLMEIDGPGENEQNSHGMHENRLKLYPVSVNYSSDALPCMTLETPEKLMEIDCLVKNEENSLGLHENGLKLYPVSVNKSGDGLPYAPENWPNPGDNWKWKVGKRIASTGYFVDRYIYPPSHLCRPGFSKKYASKLSLEHFIRTNYPDADLKDFFASFSWKVPSDQVKKGDLEMLRRPVGTALEPESNVPDSGIRCKAGNRSCSSLNAEKFSISDAMLCDICCGEPDFCRDCCCILCCEKIDNSCGGFSYFRCEADVDGYVCGHISHIECALRAYMAGTVGGSIGLDTEYICRRCDSRSDLISHVMKILQNCESIESREDLEKFLKLSICILRGSNKKRAKDLLHQTELAMTKLKNGGSLEDIWKKEDLSASISGLPLDTNAAIKSLIHEEPQHCEIGSPDLISEFNHRVESIKLEDEVDRVLDALKKSQEIEYRFALEKLSAQKSYILNLYRQLAKDKTNLTRNTSSENMDSELDSVLNNVDRIKDEVSRLKDMAEVAKGFGRVPKHILKEHFGLTDDK